MKPIKETKQLPQEHSSPLIRVRCGSAILDEHPSATYDKIQRGVFPDGVLVRLGRRSYRFHRENLIRWLSKGGGTGNGNGNEAAHHKQQAKQSSARVGQRQRRGSKL